MWLPTASHPSHYPLHSSSRSASSSALRCSKSVARNSTPADSCSTTTSPSPLETRRLPNVINKIQILEADYIANTPVAIPTIDFTNDMPASDSWFSLDGRRIGEKPTTKGLYIHNGRKVLIK